MKERSSVTARTPFDAFTEVIPGQYDSITEGEIYFWAEIHRREKLDHISLGHSNKYGVCRKCGNCLCGFTRFKCRCSAGKVDVTPYRIRSRF